MALMDFLKQATANLGGPPMQQALEKQKDDANKATSLRKALSLYDAENKDQYTTMGLPDLEGTMQSIALKSAVLRQQQEEAQLQDYQDKRKSASALENALRDAGIEQTQFPGTVTDELTASADPMGRSATMIPPVQAGASVPITNDRLLQALSRNPAAANAPQLDNLLRAVDGGTLDPNFIEDPVSGMRFLGRGRTTLPSGINPDRGMANLPAIPGFTPAPTGRGGFAWLKTPDGKIDVDQNIKLLKMQQDALLKDFTLPVDERTARLGEINQEIDKMRGGNVGGAAAAKAPKVGTVSKGYRFKGGDPAKKENWQKVP